MSLSVEHTDQTGLSLNSIPVWHDDIGGVAVMKPIPEPSLNAQLAVGIAMLSIVHRLRRRRASTPQ